MKMAVLECDCGSHSFEYDGDNYICTDCGDEWSPQHAGEHLVMIEEND